MTQRAIKFARVNRNLPPFTDSAQFFYSINSMAKVFSSHLFKNSFIQAFRINLPRRAFHPTALNMIQVGESIPSAKLYEGTPVNEVDIAEICKDKKVILFGVPGAFTPDCSRHHLPGYIDRSSELRKKGIDEIICVSVNDVFVMSAWEKDHNASGKVRLLADPNGIFTKLMGLDINIPLLGGIRSKRYAMVIEKGVVSKIHVEPDGVGLTCSLASRII